MDSIVTARVPAGIKEQGKIALQKIGATPTDLINAAYRYVLAEGKLPQVQEESFAQLKQPQKLNAEQKRKMRQQMETTTFSIPASYWEGKTDEELLRDALAEKYARAR